MHTTLKTYACAHISATVFADSTLRSLLSNLRVSQDYVSWYWSCRSYAVSAHRVSS